MLEYASILHEYGKPSVSLDSTTEGLPCFFTSPLGRNTLKSKSALDAFFTDIESHALHMAKIATRSHDDALDIVQDSMLKLTISYNERQADEWRPLFYRILQNCIRDWHRRAKFRKFWQPWHADANSEPAVEQIIDDKTLPSEHQIHVSRASKELENALQSLPLRQQQAFLLRTWEGLSVRETAEAMACSEGSVKTHCSRAMQNLRKKLEGHWP
ncbi:MAG: RNA polymerase sigma factor [Mariprofundaceae bacterium]